MEITSHYRHLLRELNEQRQHGILCDVCIIVEGKIFKAHKNVLLGSSRYFKTLYCQVQKTSDQATVTHLDIVTAQGFKAIIDFMYSAHLALTSRNVIEVMSAASYLQMTDIVQACHNFIKAALDISIKSDASDDLVDYELGAPSSSSTDALISAVVAGRSISPWLARRTSPANSSGDSAIASCHEGGSSYGKEDQEPKTDSHEDISSQSLWSSDMGYGSLRIKEEQVSPSHYGGSELHSAKDSAIQNTFSEQGVGDGWQPTGRRKNRKNKETVRHITQQVEDDSRTSSPMPSFLPASGWPYSSRDPSKSLFRFRHWHGKCWVNYICLWYDLISLWDVLACRSVRNVKTCVASDSQALCSSAGSPCCSRAGSAVKKGGNSFSALNVDQLTSPPNPIIIMGINEMKD